MDLIVDPHIFRLFESLRVHEKRKANKSIKTEENFLDRKRNK